MEPRKISELNNTLDFSVPPNVRSWAEIDLSALRRNLKVVRGKLGAKPDILAVIKANAYGHGIVPVARALAGGVRIFGVAGFLEAQEVLSAGTGCEIMLLSPCLPAERKEAVAKNFIVTVSSEGEAAAFASHGRTRINFKVDTGMGRVGAWWESALDEIRQITQMPGIQFHSISTHLPSPDEDVEFTKTQLAHFTNLAQIYRKLVPHAKIHSLNSAGILRFPEYAADIVRAGLVLYGISPILELQGEFSPVLSWKTRVALVKDLPAGTGISYGRTLITKRSTRIAVLAVGYADGFPRQVSGNDASVIIRGAKCPILGRVTMDQVVADITNVPMVTEGDEVVILGRQDNEEILATELAAKAGTIAWDILSGLKSRVARFYLG